MKLYTIDPDYLTDHKAKGYHFHIVDRRGSEVFISPIKRDGTCPTLGTVARLCRWIPTAYLKEVLPMKLYSTKAAARYLGLTESALKYHVYQGNVEPQKVGHSLIFTQAQLDEFEANRRPRGRPRSEKGTQA